jgi:multisubunit Na+/H+ antiporter MnhB subunit
VAGAGAAVALSFVVIGLFVRGAPGLRDYPRLNLLRWLGHGPAGLAVAAGTLAARVLSAEHRLYPEVVAGIAAGRLQDPGRA